MKNIIFSLLGVALLASGGCGDEKVPGGDELQLPASMSESEVADYRPYVAFYEDDAKSAIIAYETELGSVFSPEQSTGEAVAFVPASTDFPLVEYRFRSLRQFVAARLCGASAGVVWNRRFVERLTAAGYVLTESSEQAVALINPTLRVRVEIERADAAHAVRFTPTDKLPDLPELERKLIHPFHRIGATLQEITAAEREAGREVAVATEGQLYFSEPPAGTIFTRFGFFMADGKLYKTMSIVTDGDYLESDEFVAEMEADGFIRYRQEGGYSYFRDLANTIAVRTANLAPYPSIEYLSPDDITLE